MSKLTATRSVGPKDAGDHGRRHRLKAETLLA